MLIDKLFTFLISIVISVLSAIGVVTVLGHFINRKEMREFSKWLDNIEKELKEREVKR